MPVETINDQLFMLSDFGVSATYTPAGGSASNITVIFDNEYIPVDTGASVAFAMQQPKALARTIDVPGADQGDLISIDGIDYTVTIVMPDGTGMTELMLALREELYLTFRLSDNDRLITASGNVFKVRDF